MTDVQYVRTRKGDPNKLLSRLKDNGSKHADFPISLNSFNVFGNQYDKLHKMIASVQTPEHVAIADNVYTINFVSSNKNSKTIEVPSERVNEAIKQAYQVGTMQVIGKNVVKSVSDVLSVFVYSQLGMNLGDLENFEEYWSSSVNQANTRTFIVQYDADSDTVEFAEIPVKEYNDIIVKLVANVSQARKDFEVEHKVNSIKEQIESMSDSERSKLADLINNVHKNN